MLELRKELVALIEWEAEDFPCVTQPEIDAVAHRMAELLKRVREIVERNWNGSDSHSTTIGVNCYFTQNPRKKRIEGASL
jgi:hypothetical protein